MTIYSMLALICPAVYFLVTNFLGWGLRIEVGEDAFALQSHEGSQERPMHHQEVASAGRTWQTRAIRKSLAARTTLLYDPSKTMVVFRVRATLSQALHLGWGIAWLSNDTYIYFAVLMMLKKPPSSKYGLARKPEPGPWWRELKLLAHLIMIIIQA